MRMRFNVVAKLVGCAVAWGCCGCLPDSFLITPVRGELSLQEKTLYSEVMFPQGKIAVVDVDGIILNESAGSFLTPGEHPVAHLREELDKAARDSGVKAVVLRINSPGGAVTASEIMHHEVRAFREKGKPVVAMMLDVAASGGYYLACAADEIMACRSTVTGSIGVIMQTFDATGTMQKIGLRADAIKSGSQKGAGSPFAAMTPEQRAVLQQVVDELYGQFVDVVAEGRDSLSREQVVALADGRVYTAPQAVENGLIDRIGTMEDAVARAKELAGISTARVIAYGRPHRHVANYYARQPAGTPGTTVNLLNVDVAAANRQNLPPFLYLWVRP